MEGQAQAQVRLVFAGEVLEGHTLADVKRMFGEMFKLEGDRLEAVFSGQRTVLKRTIGRDDGERYVAKLKKLGMQVIVEPVDGLPEQKPVPAAAAATAAAPMVIPSLVPLEEEVTCPNCGERQPKKFVLCRKCNSDIPRALAAKQEELDRARAERLAARNGGRFAPPTADIEGGYSGEEVDAPPFLSMSFEGRFGRASYINTWGVALIAVAGAGVLAAVLTPLLGRLILLPFGLGVIVALIWGLRVNALRLHDLNRSGWWVLLTFIPYLGALVSLVLALWPGNAEENDYGPKPKRGNMVLAIALVVLSVLGTAMLLAVALPAYNSYVERAQEAAEKAAERREAREAEQNAPRLPGGPAAQAFRDQYQSAPNEKAFAVSSAGAYGFSTGKISTREAISSALADCETRREPYTSQCRVVNVNGLSPQDQ
jgi:uncharacterized membrane protein YhaH (DUF805 family)/Tfp pilus assembly major pilin PilA